MPEKMKSFVKGNEIHMIKIIQDLNTPIIHLLGTYPLYYSYGIIEYYFDRISGDKIVTMLEKDGFIEIKPNTEPRQYRLTSKGVDLAISMINLKSNKKMKELTYLIIVLSVLTIGLGIVQFFI